MAEFKTQRADNDAAADFAQDTKACRAPGCPLQASRMESGYNCCTFHAAKNPTQWSQITKNMRRNMNIIGYWLALHGLTAVDVMQSDGEIKGTRNCPRQPKESVWQFIQRFDRYLHAAVYRDCDTTAWEPTGERKTVFRARLERLTAEADRRAKAAEQDGKQAAAGGW